MRKLTSLKPEAAQTVNHIIDNVVANLVENENSFVVDSIRSELIYQARLWNDVTTITKGEHSPLAFLTFIDSYLSEARNLISRNAEQNVIEEVASIFRKIASMGLVTTYQNNHTFNSNVKYSYNFSELVSVCRCILNKAYNSIQYHNNDTGNSIATLIFIEDITTIIIQVMQNQKLAPLRELPED